MKLNIFILCFCAMSSLWAFSLDGGDAYAHQLVEADKQRMIGTGVVTPAELTEMEKFEKKVHDFINYGQGDISPQDLEMYVEHYALLSTSATRFSQQLQAQTLSSLVSIK